MSKYTGLMVWLAFSGVIGVSLGLSFFSEDEEAFISRSAFLPGPTTHGHYQIELRCNACHDAWMGVKEDSCLDCHASDLKLAKDTHPKSKFNDPTKAELLEKIDATSCIACHREHVPGETSKMGLSLPKDYCIHCHQDVAEDRPSHAGFEHQTCATAGCHNYHDNQALYESFLADHYGETDHFSDARVECCQRMSDGTDRLLTRDDADASKAHSGDASILDDWAETQHAIAGVNCRDCHQPRDDAGKRAEWSDAVNLQVCQSCHKTQADGFLASRHGMRLSVDLSPMTPEQARLPMHSSAAHQELNCNACHTAHRYDRKTAAWSSCVKCHDDQHTKNYVNSPHYKLWQAELDGEAEAGTGVSCATCHMPRVKNRSGELIVEHNQNWNLRPNEKMARSVCMSCHGLEFTLSSLADDGLIRSNFTGQPQSRTSSLRLAHDWFEQKEKQRQARLRSRQVRNPAPTQTPALVPLSAPRP